MKRATSSMPKVWAMDVSGVNWNATAERLSGRKCSVRFEQPARKGVDGLFWRLNDTAVIQISPDLETEEQVMEVFCHEVGHALHDFDAYKVYSAERPAQAAAPYTRKHLHSERVVNLEQRAQNQAEVWLEACKNCSTLFEKHITLCLWSYFNN